MTKEICVECGKEYEENVYCHKGFGFRYDKSFGSFLCDACREEIREKIKGKELVISSSHKDKPKRTTLIRRNPQEWLNRQYSDKDQVETIDLKHLDFNQPGELTINNYPNLEEIKNHEFNIPNLTKLTISNCPQLRWVNIRELKNLPILTLSNLPNLESVYCSGNNLTTLDLRNCVNLKRINFSHNLLTQIKFTNTGEKLERLDLSNQNFSQDLSFLSGLVNLKELDLSYNKFTGSLKPLQKMSKLKWLIINDTDLDSGLEHLPESVEWFKCSADERKEAKCQAIFNLFADDQGKVETREDWYIKNFPQKLKEYKQKIITEKFLTTRQNFLTTRQGTFTFQENKNEEEIRKLRQQLDDKEQETAQLRKENTELTKQLLDVKERELEELKKYIKKERKNLEDEQFDKLLDELKEKQKEIDDFKNNNSTGDKQIGKKNTQTEGEIGDGENNSLEVKAMFELLEAKIQQKKPYGIPGSSKK